MEFPILKNDRILRAARGEPVDKIPIWIMRQAGRYLPEFREVRSRYDFFEICRTPELVSEITLQPINRFDLDAAIIFSDILVIPQAIGFKVEMKEKLGPVFPEPLKSPKDVYNIKFDVLHELNYVLEAITLTRKSLDGKVPLIGFSGAPWTLFSYMIEGGPTKTCSKAKSWLYEYPEESKYLLDKLTSLIVDYLSAQFAHGAQLLQVFESNAEYLGPDLFKEFSLPYLQKICHNVKDSSKDFIPMIVFAKGAHYALEDLSKCEYDIISIDWTIDPSIARDKIGDKITLQGNLDPCALYAPKEKLSEIVHDMVDKFGKNKYICNLGHGIYPDIDPDNVKHFIDVVHSF